MKKLRRVLLIVFVVAALALALVACGQTIDTEHNHRWSEWSVDTATCTQGGTQTRICTSEGCKAQDGKPSTETRTTNALGHNVTSWTHCESDHSKHEGVCSRTDCGVTVTEAHHANAAGTECVDCGAALGGSEQCLHPNASATSETAATCTSAKIEHWTAPIAFGRKIDRSARLSATITPPLFGLLLPAASMNVNVRAAAATSKPVPATATT